MVVLEGLLGGEYPIPSNQQTSGILKSPYKHVSRLVNEGPPVDMLLLDLAKAFDKDCHRRQNSVQWASMMMLSNGQCSFFINRKLVVRVFGDNTSIFFSESADVKSGVPQGMVLGPI